MLVMPASVPLVLPAAPPEALASGPEEIDVSAPESMLDAPPVLLGAPPALPDVPPALPDVPPALPDTLLLPPAAVCDARLRSSYRSSCFVCIRFTESSGITRRVRRVIASAATAGASATHRPREQ